MEEALIVTTTEFQVKRLHAELGARENERQSESMPYEVNGHERGRDRPWIHCDFGLRATIVEPECLNRMWLLPLCEMDEKRMARRIT